MPPIRVRATLTLARHAIGWSGNFLDKQLREAKAWEEGDRRTQTRRQEADYVYDGCELDDPTTRVQMVEFLERCMWCHHRRQHDKSGKPLLLRRCDGRGFRVKQDNYDDRVGAARYFLEKFGADWKSHVKCRRESSSCFDSGASSPSSSSTSG